jgi:hypothetical protein
MSAEFVPSMFDMINEFILKALLLDAGLATRFATVVDALATAVLAVMRTKFAIFGAAIFYSLSSKNQ